MLVTWCAQIMTSRKILELLNFILPMLDHHSQTWWVISSWKGKTLFLSWFSLFAFSFADVGSVVLISLDLLERYPCTISVMDLLHWDCNVLSKSQPTSPFQIFPQKVSRGKQDFSKNSFQNHSWLQNDVWQKSLRLKNTFLKLLDAMASPVSDVFRFYALFHQCSVALIKLNTNWLVMHPVLDNNFSFCYLFPDRFVWKTKQSSSTWLDRDLFPRRPLPTKAAALAHKQLLS